MRARVVLLVCAIASLGATGCAAGSRLARTASDTGCTDDPALVPARERAVLAGARWLATYLDDQAHLEAVRSDAPHLFLEMGVTATSAALREFSLAQAASLATRLTPHYLAEGALADREALLHAVSLIDIREQLHLPAGELRDRVRARIAQAPTAQAVLGARPGHLGELSEDGLFDLLLDAWALERAGLALPELDLATVLRFVIDRPYVRLEDDHSQRHKLFLDHFYLATHVFYILGDYGGRRVDVARAPAGTARLLAWLRSEFPALVKQGNLEMVAELVDVLRATGLDARDPLVCHGDHLLLDAQLADGSWPDTTGSAEAHAGNPYFRIHPTWTGAHALRDRRW